MITFQGLIVPIPEYVALMFKPNKNKTYSYLDQYKIFIKLVEYNLRLANLLPDSSNEISDITLYNWSRRDANFEEFIERYTIEVNSCRQKDLPLKFKFYDPKKVKNTSTDIASVNTAIHISNFFNGCPLISDEQVVFTPGFDLIGGNSNATGEQTTNNQNFDMTEGNINAISEEEKANLLFEEIIDKNFCE
ncbi:6263_t:CDS:1 [Cetraspora pellucida]|uniref:6263_t:CDS:1 n=1 Tax=Cetraspora pellucida TaxID=1433469 RepID=A0A9N9GLA2_9GLOM|nr:6263_t:CDS:1 [Cetraspora pellucida]